MTTPIAKKPETKSTANESVSVKYDAKQVAKWFMEHAYEKGKQLTIMHLLKFVYIAHGWHLAERGSPLFDNTVEAWRFGPVVPDVYFTFAEEGTSYPKSNAESGIGSITDTEDRRFLERIYDKYKDMTAWKLSDLTHGRDGPWLKTKTESGLYAPIPNEHIKSHYQSKDMEEEIVT